MLKFTYCADCQVRVLLSEYLDISAVPRRYFFELLSFFASEPRERDRLKELIKPEMQVCMFACIYVCMPM